MKQRTSVYKTKNNDQMKVLFFGALAEAAGNSEIEFGAIADTASLQDELVQRYPLLNERKFAIAVNKKLVRTNTILAADSTVALLPPYSGG